MGAVDLNEAIHECGYRATLLHDVCNSLLLRVIFETAVWLNDTVEAKWRSCGTNEIMMDAPQKRKR